MIKEKPKVVTEEAQVALEELAEIILATYLAEHPLPETENSF